MVGLVAWAVSAFAMRATWLVRDWIGLLIYVIPIAAGGIVVFFMAKPLLARSPTAIPPLALRPADEPLLVAFVARVCAHLRAPVPVRIEFDDRANAAAALEGGWRGLAAGHVVLTIGMPLLAGLNLRQVAGVLAHELGHFSQSAGMRLTHVAASVNQWLARAAFERDAWDQRLREASREAGFYQIAAVALVARGALAVTRRVLALMLSLGHSINCFLLRQMEYDADLYQCAVAGSDAFAGTTRRVHELSLARQVVEADLRRGWVEDHRLPDDLPALVAHRFDAGMPVFRKAVDVAMGDRASRVMDTHPATADRVDRARLWAAPGVFRMDVAASTLFEDFPSRCREVTRLYYERRLGVEVVPSGLVPAADYLVPLAARDTATTAQLAFFGEAGPVRLLALATPGAREGDRPWRQLAEEAEQERLRMGDLAAAAAGASRRSVEITLAIRRLVIAGHLARAGVPLRLAEVGVAWADQRQGDEPADSIARARERLEAEWRAAVTPLEPFREAATRRLSAELGLLAEPGIARTIGDPAAVRGEAARLVVVANLIHARHEAMRRAADELDALEMLCRHQTQGPEAPEVQLASQVRLEALSLANSLRATAIDLLDALSGLGPPDDDTARPAWLDRLASDLAWARNVVPPEMVLLLYGRLFDFAQRVNARLIELAKLAGDAAASARQPGSPGASPGPRGGQ
jgi:Zn-dependent protease with chaperone function